VHPVDELEEGVDEKKGTEDIERSGHDAPVGSGLAPHALRAAQEFTGRILAEPA
jgi:hypothetical protein